jgi:hypothetical protein
MLMLSAAARAADGPVYELRIYTCEPGKLDALHERFSNHTMRIFEKHGIGNVAYWVPTEGPAADNTLIYLLEHESRDAAKKSWDAFRNDSEWKEVAKKSADEHGKILAKAPEATYMAPTDYSPETRPTAAGKVYELRTYTAADGKLDALNKRFRDHTDKLFRKHGMQAIGYWVPLDEPKSQNTLIYVLQHDSRESAKQSWTDFLGDEEWRQAKAESEKGGPLLSGPPQSVYMQPTEYSPQPLQKASR